MTPYNDAVIARLAQKVVAIYDETRCANTNATIARKRIVKWIASKAAQDSKITGDEMRYIAQSCRMKSY